MKNHEVIQKFIKEVLNHGNMNALNEFVHPNYKYASPLDKMDSPAELAAFVIAFRAAFPDLRVSILQQLSEEDAVFTRIRIEGTHRGEFLGISSTGKRIDVEGCVISTFEEGLIATEWEIIDQLTLLQQLGVAA